jgi:hypothetical protein
VIAFVIGFKNERTVEYEGVAEVPSKAKLPDVQAYYLERYRDGPTWLTLPGLVY